MSPVKQVWILLLCASLPAFASPRRAAKTSSSATSQPGKIPITLDVVVDGKSGPVSELQQQDFTLLDNKHPQAIQSFRTVSATGAPVKAVVVIDTVNTSFETTSTERHQLEKFFLQTGGRLAVPVSLVIYSDAGLKMQPVASTDGHAALAFLNQNPVAVHAANEPKGSEGEFDRIEKSLGALRSLAVGNLSVPGRKLLIWVSPGWPMPMPSALGLMPKEKAQIFNRIVAVTGLLLMSHTTVYVVDPNGTDDAAGFRTNRYKEYLNEIKSPSQPQVANLALQVFAIHSGGRVFVGSNDISGSLNDCLRDAESYYSISFDPPAASHPNEYHHLEIKLDKPGLKARTRSDYYWQP